MKKLTLRSEHLSELSTDEMRRVAGGAPDLRTVSDGSCGCTIPVPALVLGPSCDISDQSCGCFCPQTQTR